MSFYASLIWFRLAPERMALIWAVAAVLAYLLFAGLRMLRIGGFRRSAIVSSVCVIGCLVFLGVLIEVEFWRQISLPIQVGMPSSGGDGKTIDNDGAIRVMIGAAGICLPFILLGCVAAAASWISPRITPSAANSTQVGIH